MSNGFFYEIHDDGKAQSWAFHFHGHLSSRPAVDLLHDDGKAAQSWALHGHGHLISRPAADLLHDDGRAQSWALHDHGHLISRPAADLFHDDGRAQSWALHGHGHPISRPAANLLHDDGTPSWSPPCCITTFFLTFFLRGWTATEGCRVVCLIQARLYQMIVRSVCTVSCPSCGSVLSKTAIFPKKEGRKREIFNESARGSSLREANVYVSAKGALHDGQAQYRHCERSFGTNVLVLGKQRNNLLSPSNLLKRTSRKMSS